MTMAGGVRPRALRRGLELMSLILLGACSDIASDGSGVVVLEVRPPVPLQVEVGDTILLSARALDRNGDSIAAEIRWRTPDPLNIFVDSVTGAVAGLTPGTIGRVQATEGSLASDFIMLAVLARADTLEVPVGTIVVPAEATVSPPLEPRVAAESDTAASGFVGVAGYSVIFEIVAPLFAEPAARTVEITGAGLADTVVTGADGHPAPPVTLSRIPDRVAPATVEVEVRVFRRSGIPVPGSGQRFTVSFQ